MIDCIHVDVRRDHGSSPEHARVSTRTRTSFWQKACSLVPAPLRDKSLNTCALEYQIHTYLNESLFPRKMNTDDGKDETSEQILNLCFDWYENNYFQTDNAGPALVSAGKYLEALEHFKTAYNITQRTENMMEEIAIPNIVEQSFILDQRGVCFMHLRMYPEAEESLKQAWEKSNSVGDKDRGMRAKVITSFLHLGNAMRSENDAQVRINGVRIVREYKQKEEELIVKKEKDFRAMLNYFQILLSQTDTSNIADASIQETVEVGVAIAQSIVVELEDIENVRSGLPINASGKSIPSFASVLAAAPNPKLQCPNGHSLSKIERHDNWKCDGVLGTDGTQRCLNKDYILKRTEEHPGEIFWGHPKHPSRRCHNNCNFDLCIPCFMAVEHRYNVSNAGMDGAEVDLRIAALEHCKSWWTFGLLCIFLAKQFDHSVGEIHGVDRDKVLDVMEREIGILLVQSQVIPRRHNGNKVERLCLVALAHLQSMRENEYSTATQTYSRLLLLDLPLKMTVAMAKLNVDDILKEKELSVAHFSCVCCKREFKPIEKVKCEMCNVNFCNKCFDQIRNGDKETVGNHSKEHKGVVSVVILGQLEQHLNQLEMYWEDENKIPLDRSFLPGVSSASVVNTIFAQIYEAEGLTHPLKQTLHELQRITSADAKATFEEAQILEKEYFLNDPGMENIKVVDVEQSANGSLSLNDRWSNVTEEGVAHFLERLGHNGEALKSSDHFHYSLKLFTLGVKIIETDDRLLEKTTVTFRIMIAELYRKLGQYPKAITEYTRARTDCVKLLQVHLQNHASKLRTILPLQRLEARIHMGLGDLFRILNLPSQAYEHSKTALKLSMDVKDWKSVGDAHIALGLDLMQLDLFHDAIAHFRFAIKLCYLISANDPLLDSAYSLGILYGRIGQYKDGLKYLEFSKAYRYMNDKLEMEARALLEMGTIHWKTQEYDKALTATREAYRLFNEVWKRLQTDHDRVTFADTFGFVESGRLLQQVLSQLKQPENALEAAELARAQSFELLLAEQRLDKSNILNTSTKPTLLKEGMTLPWETLRETAVRQRACIIFYSAVEVDKLLVWVLRSSDGSLAHSSTISTTAESTSLHMLVETMRRTMGARARTQTRSSRNLMDEVSPSAFDESALHVHIERLAQEIKESKNIDSEKVADVYNPLSEISKEMTTVLLKRAYKVLLAPLEAALGDEKELIIVPDRALYGLPFAALIDDTGRHLVEKYPIRIVPSIGTLVQIEKRADESEEPCPTADTTIEETAAKNTEEWMEKWGFMEDGYMNLYDRQTIISTSLKDVLQFSEDDVEFFSFKNAGAKKEFKEALKQSNEARVRVVLVGNPTFTGWKKDGKEHLIQLRGSEKEADEIKSVFTRLKPTIKCELVLREFATKEYVQRQMETSNTSIIHLGTHGSKDGVYFAGKSEEEATLSMAEVQELTLRNVDLVVLSACDTFKGDLSSDGVVGITRAFVAAGANTIVSSLWKVSDEATGVLMKLFYENLLDDEHADTARAMQRAMNAMIHGVREIAPPGSSLASCSSYLVHEWAAFVVYGQGRTG